MLKPSAIALAVAATAWGCYGSSTALDGAADTAVDPGVDTATDPGADTAVDTATDPVPDTTGPTYALHEWGVMVYGPSGASIHGPSPEYAGAIADKPVIYIYPEAAMTIGITVGFASGAARETWPETDLGPVVSWPNIQASPGACDPTPFPSIWEDPWMDTSCEACTLGTCVVEEAACLSTLDQVAKLLFYAGEMPGYEAPLTATATLDPTGGGVFFNVGNTSDRDVEGAWMLYRKTTSVCMDPSWCPVLTADLAVGYLGSLAAGMGVTTTLGIAHLEAEVDAYGYPIDGTLGTDPEWESTPDELRLALGDHGLYPAEVEAFMTAWDAGFFGILGGDSYVIEPLYHDGAYLLYFMSREDYDDQLPLEASPPPSEAVRVGMVYQQI